MKTNPNDPATAGNEYDHGQFNPGLTKREHYAGLALQGLLANPKHLEWGTRAWLANISVYMADELILALNRTEPK